MAEKKTQTPEPKTATTPAKDPQTTGDKDTSPKLTTLSTGFLRKKSNYDRQVEMLTKRLDSTRGNVSRLQEQATKTELQLNALEAPKMADELVGPLAKAIMQQIPGFKTYEVIGPVGAQQAITVSLYEADATDEDRLKGKRCKSVTLITRTDEGIGMGVRDYGSVDNTIKPGTVAFAAGLQYKVVPVTEEASVAWLASWVK